MRQRERCDHCGRAVHSNAARYNSVPDSSAIHAQDPRWDGQRVVVACCEQHMLALWDRYQARPWNDEELWAGKIGRTIEQAMAAGRRGLSHEELMDATGLTDEQVSRGVFFQNEHAARQRDQD